MVNTQQKTHSFYCPSHVFVPILYQLTPGHGMEENIQDFLKFVSYLDVRYYHGETFNIVTSWQFHLITIIPSMRESVTTHILQKGVNSLNGALWKNLIPRRHLPFSNSLVTP